MSISRHYRGSAPESRFGNIFGNILQNSACTVTSEIRAYAVHEAGHAVVAWALGRAVKLIRVAPDEENGSRTNYVEPLDDPPSERDRAICRAGMIATAMLGIWTPVAWGSKDRRCFFSLIPSGTDGTEQNALIEKAGTVARQHLSEHRRLLDAVATALEEKRELDQEAFEAIVSRYI